MAQYLKKKTFIKVMRGYSPEEVDAYIEYLLTKYAEIAKENEDNKRKVAVALRKIQELSEKKPEKADAVAETLLAGARKESRRILEKATAEAEAILQSAEKEARRKATEAEANVRVQCEAAQRLYSEVFSFRDRLFEMYDDHIEMLENISEEANRYYDRVADMESSEEDAASDFEADETSEKAEPSFVESKTALTSSAPKTSTPITPELNALEPEPEFPESEQEQESLKLKDTNSKTVEPEFPEPEVPEPKLRTSEPEEEDDFLSELLSETEENRPYDESGEIAKYLSLADDDPELNEEDEDEPIRIDWKGPLSDDERERKSSERPAYDMEKEENSVEDFHDLDELLENGGKSAGDFSLTDEFAIVYSNRNSAKNVEEIVRQPLVAPEKPSNPKKHKIF